MISNSEQLRRRFAEEARPHFKTHLWHTVFAYLCECEVFESLTKAGIPFVRSYEGAPIDGALICPGSVPPPAHSSTNLAVWEWALEQRDVEFIPIDVKSVALHPGLGSNKNLDYTYSHPQGSKKGNAEVFFFKFEEFDDYTAIIPRAVFEHSSGASYGINGLISGVPCQWHPYMVHDSQLGAAISSLMNRDAYYTNPTTGVVFTGFRPLRTKSPALSPTATGPKVSMNVLRDFLWEIRHSGQQVTADLNPIAPLVGDMVMKIPEVSELLCIEHKHVTWTGYNPPRSLLDIEKNDATRVRKSPFAKNRMWHFLVFQSNTAPSKYVCFSRHEVDEAWIENPPKFPDLLESKKYVFRGDDAVDRVLQKIREQSAVAISTVNKIIQDMRPHDSDIESLVTGNNIESAVEFSRQVARELQSQVEEEQSRIAAEFSEEEGEDGGIEGIDKTTRDSSTSQKRPVHTTKSGVKFHKVGGLLMNSVGLHWMCDELNQQCCDHGRMICFPLDHGHCLGDHVLVDHHWTKAEQAAFEDYRTLPRYVFSPGMKDVTGIVLRFVDLSWTNPHALSYPLWMRGRYWKRPAMIQHFMFLASIVHGTTKQQAGSHYLLYPSEFTTIFEQGCREPPSSEGHRGEKYFRMILKETERLPDPAWEPIYKRRFEKPSVFVREEAPAPLRCILDLDDHSIYNHLLELMEGERSDMHIRNPQSKKTDEGFSTSMPKIKVGLLWQSAWNFGLSRRTPRISKKEEAETKRKDAATRVPAGMEPLPDIE